MNDYTRHGQMPIWATWSVILLALVISGGWNLLFAGLSGAQGEEPALSQGIIDEGLEVPATLAAETPAGAAAPQGTLQAGAVRVYLPMLAGRPQYTAQFATEVDQSLNPVAPSTSFARGVTQIYAVLALNLSCWPSCSPFRSPAQHTNWPWPRATGRVTLPPADWWTLAGTACTSSVRVRAARP